MKTHQYLIYILYFYPFTIFAMQQQNTPCPLDLYLVCNPIINRGYYKVETYKKRLQQPQSLKPECILQEFNVPETKNTYREEEKTRLLTNFLNAHDWPEPGDSQYPFVRRVLAALMYAGANPNSITQPERLIHSSVLLNDLELTTIFYNHGAPIPKNTILFVTQGIPIAQFLVQRQASIHSTNRNGHNLIHNAVRIMCDPQLIPYYISLGVNPLAKDNNGKNPLEHLVSHTNFIEKTTNKNRQKIQLLKDLT